MFSVHQGLVCNLQAVPFVETLLVTDDIIEVFCVDVWHVFIFQVL